MKRLFTLIVAMCSIIAAMAQFPMATLSHDGELTQFTGVYALQNAVDAAEKGDIIYLSEGDFLSDRGEIWIDSSISIVGCGYNSYIYPGIGMIAREEYVRDGKDSSVLDGVRLKSLIWHHDSYLIDYSIIRNCWIESFNNAAYAGKEVHIDRCIINKLGSGGSGTVYLNNCKIGATDGDFLHTIITNCNVRGYALPRIAISSIIELKNDDGMWFVRQGNHKAFNSLFQSESLIEDVETLQDCYFENPANGLLDENLNATIDLQAKGYLGQDGTIIGAYGGENPFSEYPSVPSIDSEKSSVEYDADSKKLNVTITVAKD